MKRYRKYSVCSLGLLCVCSLLLCMACESGHSSLLLNWETAKNVNRNPLGYARRLEMPKLEEGNLFNCYTSVYNGDEFVTFSIEYDPQKRHSRWVAFTFCDETAQKNWSRSQWKETKWKGDPFQPDPSLPKEAQIGDAEHRKDQYDRGHLCASEDRVYSKDANQQTFYYSNISPQLRSFNQGGAWLKLEDKIREWGHDSDMRDTLYVVKGGTIRDGEFYDSRGRHGTIVKNIDKMNGIVVPANYFMALVCRKMNCFYGIAFWFEHKEGGGKGRLSDYAISIDELEKRTGIDFFCNFPDKIEKLVETSCVPLLWNLD